MIFLIADTTGLSKYGLRLLFVIILNSLLERIKASHPHTAKRIEHLEQLSEGALSLEMQY